MMYSLVRKRSGTKGAFFLRQRFSRRQLLIQLAQAAAAACITSFIPRAEGFTAARMGRRRNTAVLPNLYAWGNNKNDRLGINDIDNLSSPILHSTTQWLKVALGETTNYYIAPDKTLWSAGIDEKNAGLPGNETIGGNNILPVQVSAESWKEIATNDRTTLAIKDNGTLWAWGTNDFGQLGRIELGDSTSSTPVLIASSTNWLALSSFYHSTLINAAGELYVTGNGGSGRLGLGNTTTISSLIRVGSATWSRVSAGAAHTVAINSDGTLWAWGRRATGALGDGGTTGSVSTPKQVSSLTTWAQVAAGDDLSFGLQNDGTLWFTGYGGGRTSGLGTLTNYSSFVQVGTGFAKINACLETFAGIKTDGTLWSWGDSQYYRVGNGSNTSVSTPVQITTATNWSSVSIGTQHTLGIQTDGTLWGWGRNTEGEVGRGNTTATSTPVRIGTDTTWTAVAAGDYCSVGIRGGGLYIWGQRTYWFSLNSVSTPIQVGAATDWVAVTLGIKDNYFAQKANGDLYGFGYNVNGGLGMDIFARVSSPVQVGTATNWTKIEISDRTAVGLRANGTLWQWGWILPQYSDFDPNYFDVTPYRLKSPVQLGSVSTWSQIAANRGVHMGIRTDGSLWVWGSASPVATNMSIHSSTPTRIGATSTWSSIAMALGSAAAIRTDGTLWTWGFNDVGQLGIGNTTAQSAPTAVGADTWTAVAAGTKHFLGIRSSGAAFGWGAGTYGQIGNSAVTNRSSPTQIGAATDWKKIWAGGNGSSGTR